MSSEDLVTLVEKLRREQEFSSFYKAQIRQTIQDINQCCDHVFHSLWLAQCLGHMLEKTKLNQILSAEWTWSLDQVGYVEFVNAAKFLRSSSLVASYNKFLGALLEQPSLLARVLVWAESEGRDSAHIISDLLSVVYGHCVFQRDHALFLDLLQELMKHLVSAATSPRDVFSGVEPIFCRVLTEYCNQLSDLHTFLAEAFAEPLAEALSFDEYLEFDVSKAGTRYQSSPETSISSGHFFDGSAFLFSEDLDNSCGHLASLATGFVESLSRLSHHFPLSIKWVLGSLKSLIRERWPEVSATDLRRPISSVLFGPVLGSTLVNPDSHGVCDMAVAVDPVARYNLSQVAAILQGCAWVLERQGGNKFPMHKVVKKMDTTSYCQLLDSLDGGYGAEPLDLPSSLPGLRRTVYLTSQTQLNNLVGLACEVADSLMRKSISSPLRDGLTSLTHQMPQPMKQMASASAYLSPSPLGSSSSSGRTPSKPSQSLRHSDTTDVTTATATRGNMRKRVSVDTGKNLAKPKRSSSTSNLNKVLQEGNPPSSGTRTATRSISPNKMSSTQSDALLRSPPGGRNFTLGGLQMPSEVLIFPIVHKGSGGSVGVRFSRAMAVAHWDFALLSQDEFMQKHDSSKKSDSALRPSVDPTPTPDPDPTLTTSPHSTDPTPTPAGPPSTDPPSTDPPSTNPPSTDPPSTDPPSTDPPSTDPPSTDPPSTDPPSTDPPSTSTDPIPTPCPPLSAGPPSTDPSPSSHTNESETTHASSDDKFIPEQAHIPSIPEIPDVSVDGMESRLVPQNGMRSSSNSTNSACSPVREQCEHRSHTGTGTRQIQSTGSDSSLSAFMSSREPSSSPQTVPKKRSITITSIENGKFALNVDLTSFRQRMCPDPPSSPNPPSPLPIITTTPTLLSPPPITSPPSLLTNGTVHPSPGSPDPATPTSLSSSHYSHLHHPDRSQSDESPNRAHLVATRDANRETSYYRMNHHELSPLNLEFSASDQDRPSSDAEAPPSDVPSTPWSSMENILEGTPVEMGGGGGGGGGVKGGGGKEKKKKWFKRKKKNKMKSQTSLPEETVAAGEGSGSEVSKKQRSKSQAVMSSLVENHGASKHRSSTHDDLLEPSTPTAKTATRHGEESSPRATLKKRRSYTIMEKYRAIVDEQKKNKEVPPIVKEKLDSLPRFVDVRMGDMSPEEFKESLFCTQLEYKLRAALQNVHIPLNSSPMHQQLRREDGDNKSQLTALLECSLQRSKWIHDHMETALLTETLKMVDQLPNTLVGVALRSAHEEQRRRQAYTGYLVESHMKFLDVRLQVGAIQTTVDRYQEVLKEQFVQFAVHQFLDCQAEQLSELGRDMISLPLADERCSLMREGLEQLTEMLLEDQAWKYWPQDGVEMVSNYLEDQLFSLLYPHVFQPNMDLDRQKDELYSSHLSTLSQGLTPTHKSLQISPIYHSGCPWLSAQKHLKAMSLFKSPRGKVHCIAESCRVLISLLQYAKVGSPPGADDLFPVLVYVLIKANPPGLLSTTQYIKNFLEDQLEGEENYWWVQFSTAVEFTKTLE